MHVLPTVADDSAASGAHFQMYLSGRPLMVRWRLLSGNNRDMCHGVAEYPDTEDCIRGLERFISRLATMQTVVRREGAEWTWLLLDNAAPAARAGHAYDRQVRCIKALSKVLADVPTAPIRTQLVVTGHRRWTGSARTNVSPSADRRLMS